MHSARTFGVPTDRSTAVMVETRPAARPAPAPTASGGRRRAGIRPTPGPAENGHRADSPTPGTRTGSPTSHPAPNRTGRLRGRSSPNRRTRQVKDGSSEAAKGLVLKRRNKSCPRRTGRLRGLPPLWVIPCTCPKGMPDRPRGVNDGAVDTPAPARPGYAQAHGMTLGLSLGQVIVG